MTKAEAIAALAMRARLAGWPPGEINAWRQRCDLAGPTVAWMNIWHNRLKAGVGFDLTLSAYPPGYTYEQPYTGFEFAQGKST